MWKYNRQILVRYLSFFAGILIAGYLLAMNAGSQEALLTRSGLKNAITEIVVACELLPLTHSIGLLMVAFLLILAGVPSIIIFTPLLLAKGFVAAYILTLAGQTGASFVSILLAFRRFRPTGSKLEFKLTALTEKFREFAFWSRVYYAFPLRTIDSMTPALHPENQPLHTIMPRVFGAIAVRMLIPSLWVNSLIKLLTSLNYNPDGDAKSLLIWTSALVVYTLIPRVPELFICPADIREALFIVESPSSGAVASSLPNGSIPKGVNVPAPKVSVKRNTGATTPQLVK